MDGIDACVVEIRRHADRPRIRSLAVTTQRYPRALRARLLGLAEALPFGVLEVAEISERVAYAFSSAASAAACKAGVDLGKIDLIASHGQTVGHRPGRPTLTVQIGEPSWIAEATGVTTIADFRCADTAAGGEGAPLVPMAHHAMFTHARKSRAIQNLGGIGNVTLLPAGCRSDSVRGSDTGPANILIDSCAQLLSAGRLRMDRGGRMAARGTSDERIVREVLAQRFFRRRLPASTGREDFGVDLARKLVSIGKRARLDDASILASVTRATARSVARSYRRLGAAGVEEVYVCGGGARNCTLLAMLSEELPGTRLSTTDALGTPADFVEAQAFAMLGYLAVLGVAGNVAEVTGARGPRVLGKIVPGKNYVGTELRRR